MSKPVRCAIYTRKSSDERLDAEYSSLDNQRAYCAAYIASQGGAGWIGLAEQYDDGGYSGGTMRRPALERLRAAIATGDIDMVVVYKIDRLSRSLKDFANLIEEFEGRGTAFVSVTQSFDTSSSMGRLMLNVLLSFAQFERELTGERLRDWFAGARSKGLWHAAAPLGYVRTEDGLLQIEEREAELVRHIFARYPKVGSVRFLARELNAKGYLNKRRQPFGEEVIKRLLRNRIYIGEIPHMGTSGPGRHEPLVDQATWRRVQKALDSRRNRPHIREPVRPMLQGLLFGPGGYAMVHHFGLGRNGQIYRYYVARPQRKTGVSCPVGRLRAAEVEDAVVQIVTGLARVPGTKIAQTDAAMTGLVQRLVQRIDVGLDSMSITLSTGGAIETVLVGRTLATRRMRSFGSIARAFPISDLN